MAERKPFLLRIDPQLWRELESWAQAELRSVNGQIEYLLRRAVDERRSRRAGSAGGVAKGQTKGAGGAKPS